jgi:hypothetical protein
MNKPSLVVGLLWFDDDPKRTFEEKVLRAVVHYKQKLGLSPSLCYVHPSALDHACTCGAVKVRPGRSVLPHHFWLGVSEEKPVVTGPRCPSPDRVATSLSSQREPVLRRPPKPVVSSSNHESRGGAEGGRGEGDA